MLQRKGLRRLDEDATTHLTRTVTDTAMAMPHTLRCIATSNCSVPARPFPAITSVAASQSPRVPMYAMTTIATFDHRSICQCSTEHHHIMVSSPRTHVREFSRKPKHASPKKLIHLGLRSRFVPLWLRLGEHLDGLHAHEVGQLAGVEVVFVGHVRERLLTTAHGLELGDADARAVELAHGVLRLLIRAGAVVWAQLPVVGVLGNVVARPKEWKWLASETQRWKQLWNVSVQLVHEAGVL